MAGRRGEKDWRRGGETKSPTFTDRSGERKDGMGARGLNQEVNKQLESIDRLLSPILAKPEKDRTRREEKLLAAHSDISKSVDSLNRLKSEQSKESQERIMSYKVEDLKPIHRKLAEEKYLAALHKAINDTIAEYKAMFPEEKEVIHDLVNRSTLTYDSLTKGGDVKAVMENINSTFYNLYSRLRSGAHPFADMLAANLKKSVLEFNAQDISAYPAKDNFVFDVTMDPKKGYRVLSLDAKNHQAYYEYEANMADFNEINAASKQAFADYVAAQAEYTDKLPSFAQDLQQYAFETFGAPALMLQLEIEKKATFDGKETLDYFLESKESKQFQQNIAHNGIQFSLRGAIQEHLAAKESKSLEELTTATQEAKQIVDGINTQVLQIESYDQDNMLAINTPFEQMKSLKQGLDPINTRVTALRKKLLSAAIPELASTINLLKSIEMAVNTIYAKAASLKIPKDQLDASMSVALDRLPSILDRVKDAVTVQDACKVAVDLLVNSPSGAQPSINQVMSSKKGLFASPMETLQKEINASIDKTVPKQQQKRVAPPGGAGF